MRYGVNPEMDRQIGEVVVAVGGAVSASLELGHEDSDRERKAEILWVGGFYH